ncbi:uncharacterized protein LOC132548350 [Ylistrum balloti]|uniref:uncharacterized protein LOC132548350 n=1 Tax=Ylistrum balloti TaxID=509963 RepID=UPI002905A015|nr:uncharacterized protein LOC132548350 [Ylistrum balloti]
MNPYGTRWRCKGKNHPAPEKGHVTQPFLRLDSTGEITSDSCSTDRYISDMGTLIDSALKLHGRMEPVTNKGFMDCRSTSNVMPMNMDSDFLLNQIEHKRTMNQRNKSSQWGSAPHWSCYRKASSRPNSCAFSDIRKSTHFYNPDFKNFQYQKNGFHPAMTGNHLGQRYSYRASPRRQHYDGHRPNCSPRNSFLPNRVPSDCTNWRKSSQEKSWRDDCQVHCDKIESKSELSHKSDSSSHTLRHSKEVNDHVKETQKPVINIKCAMPNQEKLHEDLHVKVEKHDQSEVPTTTDKENDKGSNGQKSASVQIVDWFECGQSEELDGSDIPQRIGFRVRTLSLDSEPSADSSGVNNKTLQRETSVLSDIFQPDDTVFHVTCRIQEKDSVNKDKDSGNSLEIQSNENQPATKDDQCDSVKMTITDSKQSTNCAEKKSEPSHLDKDCERRFVLLVRNNNKKGSCRPSAKKRRRSKARKEDPTEIQSYHIGIGSQKTHFQEKNCKDSSQTASATTKLGPTNTVAFVLGIDSNNSPSSSMKQHSFLVSFDSESDSFSESSGDDFSDSDGEDEDHELDFFTCPLQLNVICPVNKTCTNAPCQEPSPTKSFESEEREQEILDVNIKWNMNFSISHQEKSKTKVTFAEGDKLCTVYDVEDEDRKGHWEEFVRDRERFQRRIAEVEEILKPVLSTERRDIIYDRYFKTELEGYHLVNDH